ncbi:MAG: hypothetical protein IPM33_09395 [Phycisphaerales bacterium]|nr:hypothetical protein [Phycisphaerales bacterium]
MSEWLDRFLSLRHLSTQAGDVAFEFARPVPGWAWALILLGAAFLAGWSYSRLLGPRAARAWLAGVRAATLSLVALLLAGPQLSRPNERVEKDWVVFLVDRSESLSVRDAPAGTTRNEQLIDAFDRARPGLEGLGTERHTLYLGFDAGTFDLRGAMPPDAESLGEAMGTRTRLGAGLEQALRRVAARPVAGVVVLSDGRSADAIPRGVLRQLESRQIPVYGVALGSAQGLADLSLAEVDAPRAAFLDDIVPVNVRLDTLGPEGVPAPGARLELIDSGTGRVIDSRRVEPGEAREQRLTLTGKPSGAGPTTWLVRIVTDTPDLSARNNEQAIAFETADRPICVLHFDGYPRWEYRYLKNLFLRERSISSASLLLHPQRRYIQEGTRTLDSLPRTPAHWNENDVIVLGDLRPDLFSDDQLRQMRDLVAQRGAGILWIGGPGATPGAWRSTPLADLLPFTLTHNSGGGVGPDAYLEPVTIRPAPAAARLGVLQLGDNAQDPWPSVLSTPEAGWPLLRWAQRIETGTLKPTAETLALAVGSSASAPTPLVLTMRYGAGRVVYVGTDEIWRYRYARGETLPERFWIPLVRLLARDSLGRSGRAAIAEIQPERATPDQQVRVVVRLLDQQLIERRPASIRVTVTRDDEAAAERAGSDEFELVLQAEAGGDASAPGTYAGTFIAPRPGVYRVTSADPILAGVDLGARLEVIVADDEMRIPQTDHATLAQIAQATGGRMLQPEELGTLGATLPNRELRLLGAPDIETLWDKPLAFVLLMLLLTLEWAGRRLIKLS